MRKLISILFIMSLFTLTANAEADDASFAQNLETGQCTVSGLLEEARNNGYVSIQILDTNELDSNAVVIGGERTEHISYIETNDFYGSYTYTFMFNETALSGDYTLKIGAVDLSLPIIKTVSYINKAEIDKLVSDIQGVSEGNGTAAETEAAADEIFKLIDGKLKLLGIDDGKYTDMPEEYKKNIAKEILDNRKDYGTISEAAKRGYAAQILNITKTDILSDVIEENKTVLGLENEAMYLQYIKISNKTQFNNIFGSYVFDSNKTVKKAFNEAVLVYLVDNSQPGRITELFTEYKDIFPFDLSTYNKSDKSKTAYSLAGESINSMTELEQLIKSIYSSQNTASKDKGDRSGASGGSGGSGGVYIPQSRQTAQNAQQQDDKDNKDNKSENTFNDIGSCEWAREAIETLAKARMIAGVGEGSFEPQRNVTREEFVKLAVSVLGLYNDDYTECNFEDVDKVSWAYPFICRAAELGIVFGTDETHFGTGESITRQDMAVIIMRAMTASGRELQSLGIISNLKIKP